MRAGEQILLLHDRLELAPHQRDVPRGLRVRLAGEEPDHSQLADDRAVRADPLDTDVIHPHAAVHRRLAVGLGDDQQRAAEHPLAQVGRQLADPLGRRERRARLVGQHAQSRVGDDRDQGVVIVAPVDRVLAVAEEDEVVLRQPLQEGHCLGDLVPRVAGRRHLGELDHPANAVGHRVEVPHRQRDVADHADHVGRQLLELRIRQPAVDLEVHHRLAVQRPARRHDGGQPAVAVALDADHGVHHVADGEPAAPQLLGHAVDQERHVVDVRLEHAAAAAPAVAGTVGIERAHVDVAGTALRDELEQPGHLGREGVDPRLVERAGRDPPRVGAGELAERPVSRAVEPGQQALRDGGAGIGARARRRRAGLARHVPDATAPGPSSGAWPLHSVMTGP